MQSQSSTSSSLVLTRELLAVIDSKSLRFGYKDDCGNKWTIQQLAKKLKSGIELVDQVRSKRVYYDPSRKEARPLDLDDISQLIALGEDSDNLAKYFMDSRVPTKVEHRSPTICLDHHYSEIDIIAQGRTIRAAITDASISTGSTGFRSEVQLEGFLL